MSQKTGLGKVKACSIFFMLLMGLCLIDVQIGASSQQTDEPISGFIQLKPEGKKEIQTVKNQELEQLRALTSDFQEMGNYYLSKAKNPKDREAVLRLMGDDLQKLSLELQRASKEGTCPPGKVQCPSGSCATSKEKCGGHR